MAVVLENKSDLEEANKRIKRTIMMIDDIEKEYGNIKKLYKNRYLGKAFVVKTGKPRDPNPKKTQECNEMIRDILIELERIINEILELKKSKNLDVINEGSGKLVKDINMISEEHEKLTDFLNNDVTITITSAGTNVPGGAPHYSNWLVESLQKATLNIHYGFKEIRTLLRELESL